MPIDALGGNYVAYYLPPVRRGSAVYEIRISIGQNRWDMDSTDHGPVLRLTHPTRLVASLGRIKKRRIDEEGRIAVDALTMQFNPCFEYEGEAINIELGDPEVFYDEWTAVSSNLARYGRDFWDLVFSDPATPAWLHVRRTKADTTVETVFNGRIDVTGMTRPYLFADGLHTADETALKSVTIKASSALDLQDGTVQDLVDLADTIITADGVGSVMAFATERPFFLGFVPRPKEPGRVHVIKEEYPYRGTYDERILSLPDPLDWVTVAGVGRYTWADSSPDDVPPTADPDTDTPPVWPYGTYGIYLTRLLELIFVDLLGWTFDPATDVESSFVPKMASFDETNDVYAVSTTMSVADLAVSWNYLVGQNPYGPVGTSDAFEGPVTLARTAPVRDIVKAICFRLGAFIHVDYDPTTGLPHPKLRALPTDRGPLPDRLKAAPTADSSIQPRKLARKGVTVKARGGEQSIECRPTGDTGELLEIEMHWRTRTFGRFAKPTWPIAHLALGDKAPEEQYLFCKRFMTQPDVGDDWGNRLNAEGWGVGCYLYVPLTNVGGNAMYPNTIGLGGSPFYDDSFEGFYPVSILSEKTGTDEGRDDPLFGAAQLYAREFFGDRVGLKRTYAAFTDDDDNVAGLVCGIEETIVLSGNPTLMRVVEWDIDLDTETATAMWEEKPPTLTGDDLPVRRNGKSGQSGALSGSVSGSGTSNSSGGAPLSPVVTAGTYTYATVTVDAFGRITGISTGTPPVTGSGTTDRVAMWASATTLRAGPLINATGTLALGGGQTAEPTDTMFAISCGVTAGYSALRLESPANSNTVAALVINSQSAAGGGIITQSAATPGAVPVPCLTLVNTHARAKGLEIAPTDASNSLSRGLVLTMPSTSGGVGAEIIDLGGGGALRVAGSGGYVTTITSNTGATGTVPLLVSALSTTTVSTVEVTAGLGAGIFLTRSLVSTTEPLLKIAQTNGTQSSIAVAHAPGSSTANGAVAITTSDAPGLTVTSSTATATRHGIVVDMTGATATASGQTIAHAGLGTLITASNSNAASTAHGVSAILAGTGNVFNAITTGDGRAFNGYRNLTAATAPLAELYIDHAGDTGDVLRVRQDGTGDGASITGNGAGNCLTVTAAASSIAAVGVSMNGSGFGVSVVHNTSTGTGPAVFASALNNRSALYGLHTGTGTGYGVEASGGTRTDTLRVTTSIVPSAPAIGKVMTAVDTDGNASWEWGTEPECLNSIYFGDQTTTATNIVLAPLDAQVQVPLDLTTTPLPTGHVCNDQWNTASIYGGFTPNKTADPSGTSASGVMRIDVTFWATKPGGWTASDVTLWIDKNGTREPIGGAYVSAGTKITLTGHFVDAFNGTDVYKVYISQNVGGGLSSTLTAWKARVSTQYVGTDACAACSS